MFEQSTLQGPRVSHYDTPRQAFVGITEQFLRNESGYCDGIQGIRVYSYDNILYIHKPSQMDLVMADVGFRRQRWNKFLDHYVKPEDLSVLYYSLLTGNRAEEAGISIASTFEHRLGSCLLGITARRQPVTVTLYSRACNWAPTGILDISLACLIANRLAKDLGQTEATVCWHLSQVNLYPAKSFAWLERAGLLQDTLDGKYDHSPAGQLVRQEWSRAISDYSPSYRTYANGLKAFHRVKDEEGLGENDLYKPEIPDWYWTSFTDVPAPHRQSELTPGQVVDLITRQRPQGGETYEDKTARICRRVRLDPEKRYLPTDKKVRAFIWDWKNTERGPAGVGG